MADQRKVAPNFLSWFAAALDAAVMILTPSWPAGREPYGIGGLQTGSGQPRTDRTDSTLHRPAARPGRPASETIVKLFQSEQCQSSEPSWRRGRLRWVIAGDTSPSRADRLPLPLGNSWSLTLQPSSWHCFVAEDRVASACFSMNASFSLANCPAHQ